MHDEGVWALQANDSFSTAYSGGRDRKVWSFDLRNPDNRSLICEEKAPVLKVSHLICVLFMVPTWTGKMGKVREFYPKYREKDIFANFYFYFCADLLIEMYLLNRFLYLLNKTLENGKNYWKSRGNLSV